MKTYDTIEDNPVILKKITKYFNNIKLKKFKNKSFEEILNDILINYENTKGLGIITKYLLASKIACHLNINKTKIIIFHKKMSRAIKILNITNIKKIKINNIIFNFIELDDLLLGFKNIDIPYNENIININSNLDMAEKYLYYWQSIC